MGPIFREQLLAYCGLLRQISELLGPHSQYYISQLEDYADGTLDLLPIKELAVEEGNQWNRTFHDDEFQYMTNPEESHFIGVCMLASEIVTKMELDSCSLSINLSFF